MNTLITFCAEYLIYIATAYAVFEVYRSKDNRLMKLCVVLGAAALAWLASHFLKNIFMHPRPDLPLAYASSDPYSFPSGHASYMFALASAMYAIKKKPAYILFVLAILTGIGRVAIRVHFWYDIIGGAILGFAIATALIFIVQKFRK
jgi:undecaprenyl-diphosphatase